MTQWVCCLSGKTFGLAVCLLESGQNVIKIERLGFQVLLKRSLIPWSIGSWSLTNEFLLEHHPCYYHFPEVYNYQHLIKDIDEEIDFISNSTAFKKPVLFFRSSSNLDFVKTRRVIYSILRIVYFFIDFCFALRNFRERGVQHLEMRTSSDSSFAFNYTLKNAIVGRP